MLPLYRDGLTYLFSVGAIERRGEPQPGKKEASGGDSSYTGDRRKSNQQIRSGGAHEPSDLEDVIFGT
jgi:hypothetical protein